MKPTKQELERARQVAEAMVVNDSDPNHLAKCFNYLQHRNEALEEVFTHLERYLQFGAPSDEHAKLLVLVQRLREEELKQRGDTELDYGL